MSSLGAWEPVLQKIASLKEQEISLTDHIAIGAQKKAEQKAKRMANLRSANSTKPTNTSKNMSVQDEPTTGMEALE